MHLATSTWYGYSLSSAHSQIMTHTAMADAIARIVSEIQFLGCRMHHHDVNPTLAAFIARAVVLENATQFPLDKELNEKDVKDLIKLSTERLLESDSPSLETVKMQVGFDTPPSSPPHDRGWGRNAWRKRRRWTWPEPSAEQRESALVREICATRGSAERPATTWRR